MKLNKFAITMAVCAITLSTGILIVSAEESDLPNRNRTATTSIKDRFEKNDVRNTMAERREDLKENRASSTMMFKEIKNQKKEKVLKMKANIFEIRKNALQKELSNSLNSILRIRNQIAERIVRYENSTTSMKTRNMTEAKASLVIADGKISKAKTALELFTNTKFTLATTTASTTLDMDLNKPRKIGDEAIKAMKEARDSLKDVVQAIAHEMKVKSPTSTTTIY
jgi:uncharacterized protein (DUF342 family)